MWSLHKENYRGVLGMTALVVLAVASIAISAWGMLDFERIDFFAAATPKAQAIILSVSDCKDCSAPESFLAEFEAQGYVVASRKTVDADSTEGKKLIAQYEITKVPTVVLRKSSEAAQTFLAQFGDIKHDGTFVLNDVVPPYRDVASNTVKGRFGIIFLADKTCKECYDVALHKAALSRLGMTASDEKTIDIADKEGKELVVKYKIESVPTLIMQGDLGAYAMLNDLWDQVGTVEADGAYIFREGQDSVGAYRILKTGQIKQPVTITE